MTCGVSMEPISSHGNEGRDGPDEGSGLPLNTSDALCPLLESSCSSKAVKSTSLARVSVLDPPHWESPVPTVIGLLTWASRGVLHALGDGRAALCLGSSSSLGSHKIISASSSRFRNTFQTLISSSRVDGYSPSGLGSAHEPSTDSTQSHRCARPTFHDGCC